MVKELWERASLEPVSGGLEEESIGVELSRQTCAPLNVGLYDIHDIVRQALDAVVAEIYRDSRLLEVLGDDVWIRVVAAGGFLPGLGNGLAGQKDDLVVLEGRAIFTHCLRMAWPAGRRLGEGEGVEELSQSESSLLRLMGRCRNPPGFQSPAARRTVHPSKSTRAGALG